MSPSSFRRRTVVPALILALAAWAPEAPARPRALVRNDLASCFGAPECERAQENLATALLEQGVTPDLWLGPLEPGDLDAYDCVFDLRTVTPLDAADLDLLRAFLARGGGAYLGGENILFDARNQSIADALTALGANVVLAWPTRPAVEPRPTFFPEDVNRRTLPLHPAVDWLSACHPIDRVVYDGIGVGWFQLPGSGDVLTGFPGASPAAAWGLDRDGSEDIDLAPAGRVVSVLDLNWIANAYLLGDNRWYAGSMARWLCGGPDAEVARRAKCGPRTQGFWKRQCSGAEEPGGPELLVDAWSVLRRSVEATLRSFDLEQLEGSTDLVCDALDAAPPNDPCERALVQVTAWLLDGRYGLVTCDCPLDEAAIDAILRRDGGLGLPAGADAHGLALHLLALVDEGRCAQAAEVAAGLNEGRFLPGYEGEGETRAAPAAPGGPGAVPRRAPARGPRPRP